MPLEICWNATRLSGWFFWSTSAVSASPFLRRIFIIHCAVAFTHFILIHLDCQVWQRKEQSVNGARIFPTGTYGRIKSTVWTRMDSSQTRWCLAQCKTQLPCCKLPKSNSTSPAVQLRFLSEIACWKEIKILPCPWWGVADLGTHWNKGRSDHIRGPACLCNVIPHRASASVYNSTCNKILINDPS